MHHGFIPSSICSNPKHKKSHLDSLGIQTLLRESLGMCWAGWDLMTDSSNRSLFEVPGGGHYIYITNPTNASLFTGNPSKIAIDMIYSVSFPQNG